MINRIFISMTLLLLIFNTVDAGWQKTVTKGGKTTVTGDSETMAKLEKDKKTGAAYRKEISRAPRRKSNDPIKVTFLSHLSEKERKEQKLDKIHAGLLKEFEGDPIIKVDRYYFKKGRNSISRDRSFTGLIQQANSSGKSADVYVLTSLGAEDAVGKNKKTGKLVATKALAYRAEIMSAYNSKVHKAKQRGTIFQNVKIVKDLANDINGTIKNKIGPDLPSPSAVAKINKKYRTASLREATGIEEGDDAKTILKKLFRPKKK
jgi:hypothetical protein